MARLRIIELPMIHRGEDSETPFGVILDQVPEGSPIFASDGQLNRIFGLWGAKGVLVTQDSIELADEMPPVESDAVDWEARARSAEVKLEEFAAAATKVDAGRMDAVTNALGLDRLRDWDEIVRAAQILRDGGHHFYEPGFQDPVRCARCGIEPAKVWPMEDRRTCAEVQADSSDRLRLLGKKYDVSDREGFHADLRANYSVTKANAAKTPGLLDTHVGCSTCFDIEAVEH